MCELINVFFDKEKDNIEILSKICFTFDGIKVMESDCTFSIPDTINKSLKDIKQFVASKMGNKVPAIFESFEQSDLFLMLLDKQIAHTSLPNMKNELVDRIHTERDSYTYPVFIKDNHQIAYIINDGPREILYSSDSLYPKDEETTLEAFKRFMIKKSHCIEIFWYVDQP